MKASQRARTKPAATAAEVTSANAAAVGDVTSAAAAAAQLQDKENDGDEALPQWTSLEQAAAAYRDLHNKFRQLQQLRTTEPERLLGEFTKAAERERAVTAELIKAVEAKHAVAVQQAVAARTETQTMQATVRAHEATVERVTQEKGKLQEEASKVNAAEVQQLREQLEFYQRLSGVHVDITHKKKNSKTNICSITHSGNNGVLKYTLTERSDGFVDYALQSDALTNSVVLPAYLREEIEFEGNQLRSFFWQILDVLSNEPSQ